MHGCCLFRFRLVLVKIISQTLHAGMFSSIILFFCYHLKDWFFFSLEDICTHIKTEEGYEKELYRLSLLPTQFRDKEIGIKEVKRLLNMYTQSVATPSLRLISWFLVWYIIHYSVNRKIEVISMQRKTNELCHCRNVLHGLLPSVLKLNLDSQELRLLSCI